MSLIQIFFKTSPSATSQNLTQTTTKTHNYKRMKSPCRLCFERQNNIYFNELQNDDLSFASVLLGFDNKLITQTVSKIEEQHDISLTTWCHICRALSINIFNVEPHHSKRVMYQQFCECVLEHWKKIHMKSLLH